MSRLTDTQLVIPSAASQRDDRGVELPANVKGEAARKAADDHAGLLEEVHAAGSLPVWRRDDRNGPIALRITEQGLEAIDVDAEAEAAPEQTSVRPAPAHEVPRLLRRGGAQEARPLICARREPTVPGSIAS
jgi:hypothetical protein